MANSEREAMIDLLNTKIGNSGAFVTMTMQEAVRLFNALRDSLAAPAPAPDAEPCTVCGVVGGNAICSKCGMVAPVTTRIEYGVRTKDGREIGGMGLATAKSYLRAGGGVIAVIRRTVTESAWEPCAAGEGRTNE